jgi:tripartite ATP-independent transporter DctM subunit
VSATLAALIVFGGMFAALLAGMPLGFAMVGAGFLGCVFFIDLGAALALLGQTTYESARSESFVLIPLFMLMGSFASRAGLSEDMFSAFNAWMGQRRGGLALATIGACGAFAAVCGSSVATAATMTHVALPAMKKHGYSDRLATGSIAGGGTLGILIPPSIVMVVYGLVTETSVADLFLAGFVPGFLMVALFLATIAIIVRLDPKAGPSGPRTTFQEKIIALKSTWAMLSLFLLVIGGIYTGVFTAEEASGIGAFGALIIALISGRMNWTMFVECLMDTVQTTAMILLIVIGAFMFKNFLLLSGLSDEVGKWVSGLSLPPYGILAVILLIYLALGCVLDSIAIIFLSLPIFYPIIHHLGFDTIWFGVLVVIVIEIGLITPPVGMNVFVIAAMAPSIPLNTIFRGIWPFVAAQILTLVLIVIFPAIALWLPMTAQQYFR